MLRSILIGAILCAFSAESGLAADPPRFVGQVIGPEVGKVCYALASADVDGDAKPDIVAVANDAVVWYQNPTWRKRDILRGGTEPDNVCLQPLDVDGDGRVDFALGSAWRPADTRTGGHLAIVTRSGAPEGTWRVVPIGSEPTLHRIRWGRVEGLGKPELFVAPLQGRGTRGPTVEDWRKGPGVRILALSIPDRPFDEPWPTRVVADRYHTVHNIQVVDPRPIAPDSGAKSSLLVASGEGTFLVDPASGRPTEFALPFDAGSAPMTDLSVSEARLGRLRDGSPMVATIHPWHGDKFEVYAGTDAQFPGKLIRLRVAEGISWGHAISCADLDGDGDDEILVGQRDPNPRADPSVRGPGVILFDPVPGSNPIRFDRSWVDQGGVAVEDLIVVDLDGDGRPDVVAGGRATHNVKVYWNRP